MIPHGVPIRKASKENGILNGNLKSLSFKLLIYLKTIFHTILQLACNSTRWKMQTLKPKKESHSLESYRPLDAAAPNKLSLER